jgi:hypothetical protein
MDALTNLSYKMINSFTISHYYFTIISSKVVAYGLTEVYLDSKGEFFFRMLLGRCTKISCVNSKTGETFNYFLVLNHEIH